MKKFVLSGFAGFLAACSATPQEQAAWDDAAQKNTVRAYCGYLTAYPRGHYSSIALQRLESAVSPKELEQLPYDCPTDVAAAAGGAAASASSSTY